MNEEHTENEEARIILTDIAGRSLKPGRAGTDILARRVVAGCPVLARFVHAALAGS